MSCCGRNQVLSLCQGKNTVSGSGENEQSRVVGCLTLTEQFGERQTKQGKKRAHWRHVQGHSFHLEKNGKSGEQYPGDGWSFSAHNRWMSASLTRRPKGALTWLRVKGIVSTETLGVLNMSHAEDMPFMPALYQVSAYILIDKIWKQCPNKFGFHNKLFPNVSCLNH